MYYLHESEQEATRSAYGLLGVTKVVENYIEEGVDVELVVFANVDGSRGESLKCGLRDTEVVIL